MTDKTRAQQLIIAFTIAALLLVLLLISAYVADRVDGALGHGPLPSGLGSGRAFLATLLAGAMAAVAGGATLVGLRQAKYSAPQQAWVVYALVALPLVVLLLVPLQLYGAGTFVGLPDWLVRRTRADGAGGNGGRAAARWHRHTRAARRWPRRQNSEEAEVDRGRGWQACPAASPRARHACCPTCRRRRAASTTPI